MCIDIKGGPDALFKVNIPIHLRQLIDRAVRDRDGFAPGHLARKLLERIHTPHWACGGGAHCAHACAGHTTRKQVTSPHTAHHCTCTDDGSVTDLCTGQHHRPMPQPDIIANHRITLIGLKAHARVWIKGRKGIAA